jgi:hypothetical protein
MRKPRLITTGFAALNSLYVLVATGRAKIDGRRKSAELYFNVFSKSR